MSAALTCVIKFTPGADANAVQLVVINPVGGVDEVLSGNGQPVISIAFDELVPLIVLITIRASTHTRLPIRV